MVRAGDCKLPCQADGDIQSLVDDFDNLVVGLDNMVQPLVKRRKFLTPKPKAAPKAKKAAKRKCQD